MQDTRFQCAGYELDTCDELDMCNALAELADGSNGEHPASPTFVTEYICNPFSPAYEELVAFYRVELISSDDGADGLEYSVELYKVSKEQMQAALDNKRRCQAIAAQTNAEWERKFFAALSNELVAAENRAAANGNLSAFGPLTERQSSLIVTGNQFAKVEA